MTSQGGDDVIRCEGGGNGVTGNDVTKSGKNGRIKLPEMTSLGAEH